VPPSASSLHQPDFRFHSSFLSHHHLV
jgi:hypothetical protein